ncbi:hypothetical protein J2X32_003555 [Rheinheimera pacifica]|uniref:hypothetical protein n=1 Tax=Rheinheimera pacifica TaxID=173990 RepID=UPI002862EAF0|nr:hypothetical protein [Rheinheimera pacifica]MDR6984900.1 hypothetical protein [Rheinheimera pacifica]
MQKRDFYWTRYVLLRSQALATLELPVELAVKLKVFIFLLALCSVCLKAEKIKVPENESVGYSCFKEPTWPNEKKIRYLCVFELNTVSPFYSEDNRNQVLRQFVRTVDSECEISEGKEMTAPKATVDHVMFLIVYHVKCS